MNTALAELGRRYLERWVAVLVLPGLLFVASVVTARRLGHRHWADLDRLAALPKLIAGADARGARGWVLLLIALPVLSAAAGLAARGVTAALARMWFDPWPKALRGLTRRASARRAKRWELAEAESAAARASAGKTPTREARARLDALAARRNAICLVPPERPMWMSDRLNAVDARVWAWYGLDVVFAWPRLWFVLTEPEQNTLRSSRSDLDAAVALSAWGVLYALLAVWWWPALPLAAVVFTVGWRRTRTAVDTVAHLAEAAFDLRAAALARELGFATPDDRLTPEIGSRVTAHLRKHA